MADLTKVTTIADNTREVVMAFQYQYVDTGNESAVSKIDVSALAVNADGETCTGIRIVECWWVISAMTVEILADADTDILLVLVLVLVLLYIRINIRYFYFSMSICLCTSSSSF